MRARRAGTRRAGSLARRGPGAVRHSRIVPYGARSPARSAAEGHAQTPFEVTKPPSSSNPDHRTSMIRQMNTRHAALLLAALALPTALGAQQKQRFASLDQALQSTPMMAGRSGPRSVNWIEGGNRFSYLDRDAAGKEVIRAYDPATGRDTMLFSAQGLTFPGTQQPFAYESFQWSRDS